jgi:excisionase family DNA binding protein
MACYEELATGGPRRLAANSPGLPLLLTVAEVASVLRTTPKGVYAMVERGLLPGVTRVGRRVLIRSADLLDWLRQKSTPSPEG